MKLKDRILDVLSCVWPILLFVAVLIVLCVGICHTEEKDLELKWNNGICRQCGKEVHYNDTTDLSGSVVYLYKCEGCGDILIFKEFPDK